MEEIKNKLTIQEAAPYIGCEVIVYDDNLQPHKKIFNEQTIFDIMLYAYGFQLILRSIEDMTEEEYEKYSDLAELLLKAKTAIDSVKYWSKIINYLRSIGVDTDNLIGQNKAIRKQ